MIRRFIISTFCLLILLTTQCIFSYAAKPTVNVKLSFTAPQKGQRLTIGKPFVCKGSIKCSPANTDLSKVYVWLFLMDVREGCYYIQRPVSVIKSSWSGTIAFRKDTTRVIAILADTSTDKLFKSWLAKGFTGKQYELPRNAEFLTSVDIKL